MPFLTSDINTRPNISQYKQFSAGSKSRHSINKKLFYPQLVSDQRLEGCQIIEKDNCSKLSTLRVLHTLFPAIFSQKCVLILGGSRVCLHCMPHVTAHIFGQMISAKYDVYC